MHMESSDIPPSLKKEGWLRGPKKYRDATLLRADGVVSSAKVAGLNIPPGLTTPSAALQWLRDILFMPHPPLLFKEGNMLVQCSCRCLKGFGPFALY